MQTVITSKFQTTIPKKIREALLLTEKDVLNWHLEDGRIIVSPAHADFLKYKNAVKTGRGDIETDIRQARHIRAARYKQK